MILIASLENQSALSWRTTLAPFFKFYEVDIHTHNLLERTLKKVTVDALLIDLSLLKEGTHEIASLIEIQPTLRVIVMTKIPSEREEMAAILFGAKAYCAFDLEPALLVKVVNTVLKDELWVDRRFVSRLLAEIEDITHARQEEAQVLDKGIAKLTPRENEIASLLAMGKNNRSIATQLGITERTVKAHLGVIFKKMGMSDRLQLALYMNRHQQLPAIWHGIYPKEER